MSLGGIQVTYEEAQVLRNTGLLTNTQVSWEADSSATVGPGPEVTAAPANSLTATL